MLAGDHLVAIDNHTDLAQGSGKLTIGLEAFKDSAFLSNVLQQFNAWFDVSDPFYLKTFQEGVSQGIQTLAATFTDTVEGRKVVSREKIEKFVAKSQVPDEFTTKVIENIEIRMAIIIELADDSMYHLKDKDTKGCCILM